MLSSFDIPLLRIGILAGLVKRLARGVRNAAELGLLLFAFGQASTACAQDIDPDATWACEYQVAPGDIWVARCYEPLAIAEYEPLLDPPKKLIWDVPIWGPPMSEARTTQLVRAVLCRGIHECVVVVSNTRRSSAWSR